MKYNPTKRYQLKYEITDRKLRDAIRRVSERGVDPTVRLVAEEAGVAIPTAYSHKCPDMILEELMKK